MTKHEELIEKVANTLIMTLEPSLTGDDFIKASTAAIDTIYVEMQQPTRIIWAHGDDAAVKKSGRHHDVISGGVWQTMLAVSPLAPEGGIGAT